MITFATEFTGETTIDDLLKLTEFNELQLKWNQRLIDEICEHDKPSIPLETPIETRIDDVEMFLDEIARRVERLENESQTQDEENHFLKTYNTFLEHQLERVRENG